MSDDQLIAALSALAARETGFSRDAVLPDAIRRAAARLGGDDLLARAYRSDPALVHELRQAVSVGETFFFRHPEHFRYLAHDLLPALHDRPQVRAWSAGCATGEETYSIAACLLDALPDRQVDVLGTDLVARNVAAARAAEYGAWSRRPSAPLLYPVFEKSAAERQRVLARLRAVTRFAEHNLLGPPPGEFEVVFCRNVLVYFSPDAAAIALRHLAAAVAPGGALFLGPMDVGEPPRGLAREGAPELQIFRRLPGGPRAAAPRPTPPPPLPTPEYVPRVRPPEPVALHVRALVHIERGDRQVAQHALAELIKLVPDYVPGLLERALLHVRMGEKTAASQLMREVLRRTEKLAPDHLLPGPEPLPVSFYRDSAETFLRSGR